ncbi:hypothetical protein N7528_006845 [Penicillium herquei]|nr:hypothetical protein N7528_006845 [Penicillium herquei]
MKRIVLSQQVSLHLIIYQPPGSAKLQAAFGFHGDQVSVHTTPLLHLPGPPTPAHALSYRPRGRPPRYWARGPVPNPPVHNEAALENGSRLLDLEIMRLVARLAQLQDERRRRQLRTEWRPLSEQLRNLARRFRSPER